MFGQAACGVLGKEPFSQVDHIVGIVERQACIVGRRRNIAGIRPVWRLVHPRRCSVYVSPEIRRHSSALVKMCSLLLPEEKHPDATDLKQTRERWTTLGSARQDSRILEERPIRLLVPKTDGLLPVDISHPTEVGERRVISPQSRGTGAGGAMARRSSAQSVQCAFDGSWGHDSVLHRSRPIRCDHPQRPGRFLETRQPPRSCPEGNDHRLTRSNSPLLSESATSASVSPHGASAVNIRSGLRIGRSGRHRW